MITQVGHATRRKQSSSPYFDPNIFAKALFFSTSRSKTLVPELFSAHYV